MQRPNENSVYLTDSSGEESEASGDQDATLTEADGSVKENREPKQVKPRDQTNVCKTQKNETTPRRSERKWKPVSRSGYVTYLAAEE